MNGVRWALASVACSAATGVFIKVLTGHYPVAQVVCFRFAVGSLTLLPLFLRHGLQVAVPRRPLLQLGRGLLTFAAVMATFAAISKLPLADYTILSFTAPLIMAVLSRPMLNERPGPRSLFAVCLGFAGVVVAFAADAGPGLASVAVWLALTAALLEAMANAMAKVVARHDSIETTVVWFTLVNGSLATLVASSDWIAPQPADLVLFLVLGGAANAAQWCMIKAMTECQALTVSTLGYLLIPIMAVMDFAVFSLPPAPAFYPAAGLVLASAGIGYWSARRPAHGNESRLTRRQDQ